MRWKTWLIVVGVLLFVLMGILAGMARAFGTNLFHMLDVIVEGLGRISFWTLVVGGVAIVLPAVAVLLIARLRRRTDRSAPAAALAHADVAGTAAPTRVSRPAPMSRPAPPDLVPGPRDFVPSAPVRPSDDGVTGHR